jgi:hypothetical protein
MFNGEYTAGQQDVALEAGHAARIEFLKDDFFRIQGSASVSAGASISYADKLKVNIDAGGILFGSDTAAANALDDYEEGTWTPGTVTGTWNTASGYYKKIGRLVQATAYLYGCTNTTASDEVRVNGLPFTPSLTTTAGVNMPESSTGFHIAIVNSSNYVTIATPDGAATIHTMEHGDISTGGNTGRLHLHITYQMST